MKKRWSEFTPEEKTAYINKMQTGGEEQRMVMINAWNKCLDIRIALSDYLKKNNYHNPQNIIYKETSFSESMSKVMSEFWAENPEFCRILGEAITNSYDEIENAKENGTYGDLQTKILEEKTKIKKEMKKNTSVQKPHGQKVPNTEQLKAAYLKKYPYLPAKYIRAKFETDYVKNLSEDELRVWIKYYNSQKLTPQEQEILIKMAKNNEVTKEIPREYNAVNFAMADELTAAKQFEVIPYNFYLDKSDILNYALDYIKVNGIKKPVVIPAHEGKEEKSIKFNFIPKVSNIEKSYDYYSEPLTQEEADKITKAVLNYIPKDKQDESIPAIQAALKKHGKYMLGILDDNNSYAGLKKQALLCLLHDEDNIMLDWNKMHSDIISSLTNYLKENNVPDEKINSIVIQSLKILFTK